ncbi:MAG: hypothetical protein GDA40_12050 [Rhodobacteraceae bacterium]|nr:hypothetical protein [Paracoccaceae bacterium]
MQYVDHRAYYSFFEDVGSNRLIVGFSGSAMIEINEQRSVPIQCQAPRFREQDVSYLTLTAKMLDFWPETCLNILEEAYMPFRRWFRDINVFGYSVGGWAGTA